MGGREFVHLPPLYSHAPIWSRNVSSMCGNDENLDFYQRAKEEDPAKPKRFRYTSKDLIAKTCISRSTDFEASPPIVHFAGPILL